MSGGAVIAIAIVVAVVLAALVFVTTARRSDVRGAGALSSETRRRDQSARGSRTGAEAAERAGEEARHGLPVKAVPSAPVPWTPPDPEAIGVSRRQFFNRATVTLTSASIGTFAAAGFVAFLWPSATGGFGQVVRVGKLGDIIDGARANAGFFYAPSARTWFTEFPAEALPKAAAAYDQPTYNYLNDYGVIALYQKCPHLGCRVPECKTSGWFECPCHGSQYNKVGEKKGGPAPRGMSRFLISVDAGGNVSVDTSKPIDGPPIGTNTTGQEAEGPHCVGGGEH